MLKKDQPSLYIFASFFVFIFFLRMFHQLLALGLAWAGVQKQHHLHRTVDFMFLPS